MLRAPFAIGATRGRKHLPQGLRERKVEQIVSFYFEMQVSRLPYPTMNPYWISAANLRLAIIPRPRGADWLPDEVRLLRDAGVQVVVSALTSQESEELGLAAETSCCESAGVEFLNLPIEDRSVPSSSSEFAQFVGRIDFKLKQGKSVGIHCRAGIGRSAMIAAALLVKNGYMAGEAFNLIEKARGCSVPDTPEQRRWIERLPSS
jgi:protein-tyrosine phosphatase